MVKLFEILFVIFKFMNEKILLEAINKDYLTKKEIIEICMIAIKKAVGLFRFVPNIYKSRKLCMEAVRLFGFNIEYVPKEHLTEGLCLLSLDRNNGEAIMYIPVEMRTEKIYFAALKNGFYDVNFFPDEIVKNTITSLDKAFYPTKQIISYIRTVHDRISLEIMRGCPHACRFCQASSTSRPLRMRSVESLVDLAEKTYKATGYSQISLLSLSSVNYPNLKELIQGQKAYQDVKAPALSNASNMGGLVSSIMNNVAETGPSLL